jgi:hypothetical protein
VDPVGLDHFHLTFSGSGHPPIAESQEVSQAELRAFGSGLLSPLENSQPSHIASFCSCACQFHSHWGLPCRRMLLVWLQLSVHALPDGVVHRR